MDALTSWGLFLALIGAGYWYYAHNKPRGARQRGRSLLRANNTTTAKGDVQWSEPESGSKTKPAKAKAPRKSVKKALQEVGEKAEAYLSAASTAGADADDDLSPAVSPALGATTAPKAPSGKDVSDMLEPQAARNVLKINQSEQPQRQGRPSQPRTETPQETKKQRQNRKKAEGAKAQREEAEKERQGLLEKQRRAAREARGEPAKNGLQPAKAPAANAWGNGGASSAVKEAPQNGQLLDTFDPDVASTASSSEAATNGTAPTPDSHGNNGDWSLGMSEEDQVRMALEETAWETVPKGRKQRKNKAADESTEDGTDTGAPQETAPVKNVPAKQVENKKPASRFEVLSEPAPQVSHPVDSEWGVV